MSPRVARTILFVVILIALAVTFVYPAFALAPAPQNCSIGGSSPPPSDPIAPDAVGTCCFRIFGICWCVVCMYPGWNLC